MKFLKYVVIFTALFMLAAVSRAETKPPEISHDGLHLQQDASVRLVYRKPDADLSHYDKVALLETYVAFKKNWKRDYNRDHMRLDGRITDRDMQRIRKQVAEEFRKIFTQVLSTEGGHEMVTEGAEGVLIIRPAIINLDVVAPDKMTAGVDRSFSADAGTMTLYMELYDGQTGDILARVIDPKVVGDSLWKIRNRVTNIADADRVLRRWAELLNGHLAHVKSPP